MSYKVINIEQSTDWGIPSDYKITVVEEPSWLSKLFGIKPQTSVFIGSRTVFYEQSTGRRPGIMMEKWLNEQLWLYTKGKR